MKYIKAQTNKSAVSCALNCVLAAITASDKNTHKPDTFHYLMQQDWWKYHIFVINSERKIQPRQLWLNIVTSFQYICSIHYTDMCPKAASAVRCFVRCTTAPPSGFTHFSLLLSFCLPKTLSINYACSFIHFHCILSIKKRWKQI